MNERIIETIMEAVCEICHHPYVVADQERLDAVCSNCPVEQLLKEVKNVKENQILVIIKEPGKEPTVEPLFENTLEAFQQAVGGHIETCTLATDLVIICNEEGRLKRLPWNCIAFGVDFVGTILVAGVNGDEFASLKAKHIPLLLRSLGGKVCD